MIIYEQHSIIFLLNNRGYKIEYEIHDGPYNIIKNWNYTRLVELHNKWLQLSKTIMDTHDAFTSHIEFSSYQFVEISCSTFHKYGTMCKKYVVLHHLEHIVPKKLCQITLFHETLV
jgi:TPP-dependent 2-oxoacid decarboxylase